MFCLSKRSAEKWFQKRITEEYKAWPPDRAISIHVLACKGSGIVMPLHRTDVRMLVKLLLVNLAPFQITLEKMSINWRAARSGWEASGMYSEPFKPDDSSVLPAHDTKEIALSMESGACSTDPPKDSDYAGTSVSGVLRVSSRAWPVFECDQSFGSMVPAFLDVSGFERQ